MTDSTLTGRPTVTPPSTSARRRPVVQWAAYVGAALLAFQAFIFFRWVTGDGFQKVDPGPSPIPDWMKAGIYIGEIVSLILGAAVIYWVTIRPWRRDGKPTLDGLIVLGLLTASFYDPLANYFTTWFGYNAYFLNFGNPMASMPGWQTHAEPGETQAWAFLFLMPGYCYAVFGTIVLASMMMRKARQFRPEAGIWLPLLTSVIFVCFFDLLLEAYLFLPLGWYAEAGPGLNEDKYWLDPYGNILGYALACTAMASLRVFRNDHGESYAERGASRLSNTRTQTRARLLAVVAAIQLSCFVGYHAPLAVYNGVIDPEWPQETQERSYLTNNICGDHTPRTCPQ